VPSKISGTQAGCTSSFQFIKLILSYRVCNTRPLWQQTYHHWTPLLVQITELSDKSTNL